MRRRADAIPDYTRNDSPKRQNQASTINVEVLLGRTIISGGSRSFFMERRDGRLHDKAVSRRSLTHADTPTKRVSKHDSCRHIAFAELRARRARVFCPLGCQHSSFMSSEVHSRNCFFRSRPELCSVLARGRLLLVQIAYVHYGATTSSHAPLNVVAASVHNQLTSFIVDVALLCEGRSQKPTAVFFLRANALPRRGDREF